MKNFSIIKQCVIIAAVRERKVKPADYFSAFGFAPYHTGGGCMSLAIFNPDGSHLLITDRDGDGIPEKMADVMIGEYDTNGDPVGEVWEAADVCLISISAESKRRLDSHAMNGNTKDAFLLPDGRYEIQIDPETKGYLMQVDQNVDRAIEILTTSGIGHA